MCNLIQTLAGVATIFGFLVLFILFSWGVVSCAIYNKELHELEKDKRMAEHYPDGAIVYHRMEAEKYWSNRINRLV